MENNNHYTPLNPNFFSDNKNQFLNNISTPPIVYKKRSANLIVLIALILLILLIIFFLLSPNKKSVWLPKYIPEGFAPLGDVQMQIINNNKEAYVLGYSNPTKGEIVFTQQIDTEFRCEKINPNLPSFTDYKVFDINGIEACAITGFGKDRIYNWVNGSNRFTLKAKNLSISDTEFTKIASSLILQKVKIVNVK